jgi:molybdopterin-guanine dinucleotide biosynthesis adapter protein
MIPAVHFVGKSGTGKTTLIESIVLTLKGKGYRVAVVKHAHHGFEMDKPGKDSWRFGQAGSDMVAISSPGKLAMLEKVDGELDFEQVNSRLGDRFDIVLVEGFKQTSKVKIEITGSETNEDIEKIVDFIVSHIPQKK